MSADSGAVVSSSQAHRSQAASQGLLEAARQEQGRCGPQPGYSGLEDQPPEAAESCCSPTPASCAYTVLSTHPQAASSLRAQSSPAKLGVAGLIASLCQAPHSLRQASAPYAEADPAVACLIHSCWSSAGSAAHDAGMPGTAGAASGSTAAACSASAVSSQQSASRQTATASLPSDVTAARAWRHSSINGSLLAAGCLLVGAADQHICNRSHAKQAL